MSLRAKEVASCAAVSLHAAVSLGAEEVALRAAAGLRAGTTLAGDLPAVRLLRRGVRMIGSRHDDQQTMCMANVVYGDVFERRICQSRPEKKARCNTWR